MKRLLPCVLPVLLLSFNLNAADVPSYTLTLKDHRYQPGELHVPANTRILLQLVNLDASPEEFESDDFAAEKIVMPNSRTSLYIGPFKPGRYRFYGDFHQPTAQGVLVVE